MNTKQIVKKFNREHRKELVEKIKIEKKITDIEIERAKEGKSVCCGARMIGGAQCEACGADGRVSEEYPLGGMVEPYDIERDKKL